MGNQFLPAERAIVFILINVAKEVTSGTNFVAILRHKDSFPITDYFVYGRTKFKYCAKLRSGNITMLLSFENQQVKLNLFYMTVKFFVYSIS